MWDPLYDCARRESCMVEITSWSSSLVFHFLKFEKVVGTLFCVPTYDIDVPFDKETSSQNGQVLIVIGMRIFAILVLHLIWWG